MIRIINIFLLLSIYLYSQDISFIKEDITFKLDNEFFSVDGLYWFCNNSNKKIIKIIYYPFEPNSSLEYIDSIKVYNIKKNLLENIINIERKGFSYLLNIAEKDTLVYRIEYRQKILTDSVKYVLTSTGFWNLPLESAEYKLITSDQFEITEFSYKPDKSFNIENEIIYYWKRNNFNPKLDFVIHFRTVDK